MDTWTVRLSCNSLLSSPANLWKKMKVYINFIIEITYISNSSSLFLTTSSFERPLQIWVGTSLKLCMLENGGSWWGLWRPECSAPMRVISDLSHYFSPCGIWVLISLVKTRGLSVIGSIRIVVNICHIGRKNSCLNSLLDCF